MVWGIEIEHNNFQLKLRSYHPKSRPLSINNISLGADIIFFACSIVMKNIIIMKVIVNNYVFVLLNS